MATPGFSKRSEANMALGITRWAEQMIATLFISGVLLFQAAGRLDWIRGWVYPEINTLTQVLSAIVPIPRRPEILASPLSVVGFVAWGLVLLVIPALLAV